MPISQSRVSIESVVHHQTIQDLQLEQSYDHSPWKFHLVRKMRIDDRNDNRSCTAMQSRTEDALADESGFTLDLIVDDRVGVIDPRLVRAVDVLL